MLWFSDVFRTAYGYMQLFTPQINALDCYAFLCVSVFALYGFSLSPLCLGCHLKFLVPSVNHNVPSHFHLHHPPPFFTANILWVRIWVLCMLKLCIRLKVFDWKLQNFMNKMHGLWSLCLSVQQLPAYFLFSCCFLGRQDC